MARRERIKVKELTHEPGRDASAKAPPMAAGWPLVGNALPFLKDPHRCSLKFYRRLGPVFRLKVGPKVFTMLCGPEATRWVGQHDGEFVTVEGIYDNIHRILQSDPNISMLSGDGERHKELRAWQRRGMSRKYSESRLEVSLRIAREEFEEASRAREPIDMVEVCKALVYRQLGTTMTGEAPMDLLQDNMAIIDAVINSVRFPFMRYLPLSKRLLRSYERVSRFSRAVLDAHSGPLNDGEERLFVHDVLDGVKKGVCRVEDTTSVLIGPYLAGLDTLAHQLGFAIWALSTNQEALARVVADTDALFADGDPSPKGFGAAQALRGAAMESMRLYPISPGIIRRVKADVVLNGYQLREGDELFVPHPMSHLMKEYFPNPESFDIDRFTGDRAEHRTRGAYAPYGVGRHICLGAGTADLLLLVNLAVLNHRYRVVPQSRDLKTQWISSISPRGFRARVVPR